MMMLTVSSPTITRSWSEGSLTLAESSSIFSPLANLSKGFIDSTRFLPEADSAAVRISIVVVIMLSRFNIVSLLGLKPVVALQVESHTEHD